MSSPIPERELDRETRELSVGGTVYLCKGCDAPYPRMLSLRVHEHTCAAIEDVDE